MEINSIPSRWANPSLAGMEVALAEGHLGGTSTRGDPHTWYPQLWDWLIETFDIKTVLDVGCGIGLTTKYFNDLSDLGIEALGVDGYPPCLENSVCKDKCVLHDYTAGVFLTTKRFDLIYASEFLEHVEEKCVGNILHTFTYGNEVACISPALPEAGGYHHVNCKPSKYWIELMASIDWKFSLDYTQKARSLVEPRGSSPSYFGANGLIFTR
jgi:SAM-dependent methyltransferase